jgi:hypothetical protein
MGLSYCSELSVPEPGITANQQLLQKSAITVHLQFLFSAFSQAVTVHFCITNRRKTKTRRKPVKIPNVNEYYGTVYHCLSSNIHSSIAKPKSQG